jgi:ribose/xylose/arabinose/galactoside ABC-type transport system permease subunit
MLAKMSKFNKKKLPLLLIDNMIWLILAGIYIIFALMLPAFWSPSFLFKLVYFSIPLGFIILAVATCLIAGVFDISVGQLTGFVAVLSATLIVDGCFSGLPTPLLILLPILLGLGCGALNGFLVGKLKLNPFLATLGTYLVFYGAKLQISGASTVSGLPDAYLLLGGESIPTILLFAGVFAMLFLVLKKTRFGHHVYSIGGNAEASEMLGINKTRVIFIVYIISGILCGFAALTYTGFVSAASPTVASDTVFMAFAGAILAGVSINGGRGSLLNVLGGILLITVIEAGLTMMSVSVYTRQILFGVLVIVAIILNRSTARLKDKILLPK